MAAVFPPPLPPSPDPADAPIAPEGQVVCPACGWRESSGVNFCRSCGAALAGLPVQMTISGPASRNLSRTLAPALSVVDPTGIMRQLWDRGKRWGVIGLIAAGMWWSFSGRPVRYAAGMLVGSSPVQGPVEGIQPWTLPDGTRVIPLATYEINARLLHRERYRFDAMADIAPVDFCVGWHRMSDQSVIDGFSFSNSGRYMTFTTESAVEAAMSRGSLCNMHMVPADDRVRDRLLDLNQGEVFLAKGYLVSVRRPGTNAWNSSLTREDTGDGSCEIMWVEAIRRVEPPGARKE